GYRVTYLRLVLVYVSLLAPAHVRFPYTPLFRSRIASIAADCSSVGSADSNCAGSPIILDSSGKAVMEYFSYCFSGRSNSSWLIMPSILPCSVNTLSQRRL